VETTRTLTYVDVAVDAQLADRDRLFTYLLPESLVERVTERQLVWIPLRKELKLGITIKIHTQAPAVMTRPVHAPVEPEFRLSPRQWTIVEWLRHNTLCTLFEAVTLFLPPGVTQRSVEYLRIKPGVDLSEAKLTPAQRRLADLLAERGELSIEAARQALGSSLASVIPRLDEAGIIERTARVKNRASAPATTRFVRLLPGIELDLHRTPAQRRALEVVRRRAAVTHGAALAWDDLVRRAGVTAVSLKALDKRGAIEIIVGPQTVIAASASGSSGQRVQLTTEQSQVWQQVVLALRRERFHEFLLHGVTGSGKTEIYLRAAAWALSRGRQVVMLVPEISLAAQVVGRFIERFPGRVAVLHSGLRDAERYQTWQAIASGQISVVVGPRSALFAPFKDIGFIAVDEEHEDAYKQDTPPRYHARQVAREVAKQHNAVLLLGSATPDVGTFRAAQEREIELLELRSRVGPRLLTDHDSARVNLALPTVDVVDMRQELQQGNTHIFSRLLQEQMARAVDAREQVILFLNRRGQSTFVQCRSCGYVEKCPYCDVPLCFHGDQRQIICHRCGYHKPPPHRCPNCSSNAIGYYGTGTQRVEIETKRLLPEARVMRWDRDALKRGVDHASLMQRVLTHDVDIVVGTQMVAKGLDFPLVSTIGVINADTVLHLPDFRASERTFQLLTQVAGRAGRRAPGSRVVVQSFSPDHFAIQTACTYDYDRFFNDEIAGRQQLGYPPFLRLVKLVYRHSNEETCQTAAEEMADALARGAYDLGLERVDLIGPTPSFTARLRGRYQWQILLRGDDALGLAESMQFDPGWLVDVDPVSLL
jgi:primosomal protein N' (replication factor Y) (superfamily II helicase)